MREFKVTYQIDNREMLEGREPHDQARYDVEEMIEAESEEEAVALVLQWMQDQSDKASEIDEENERITFFDNDEAVEQYYNFKAEEVI